MKILNQKLLLASKSPRRQQLMKEAGFLFEVILLDVEENYPSDLPKEKVPEYLANKKAQAAFSKMKNNDILIAADTIVVINNQILEKAQNKSEAREMLQMLSGQQHQVITGVCMATTKKRITFSAISNVWMSLLNEEEINYYIDTFQPFDKAGAYGIQDWIGICKVEKIEGSYTNIVGLPTDLIYKHIKNLIPV
ncbi:MAG: septum formation protein Maf [Saprospiraceae bacterium]|nr:septum formation protein Maf [Saprospiraceae bacterium]